MTENPKAGLTREVELRNNARLKSLLRRIEEMVHEAAAKNVTGKGTVELQFRGGEFIRATVMVPETIE